MTKVIVNFITRRDIYDKIDARHEELLEKYRETSQKIRALNEAIDQLSSDTVKKIADDVNL